MDRKALERRWLELMRETLPGMAAEQRWPIRFDHCFMRVCLDGSFGGVWTAFTARPAIRTMSDTQLERAIDVALQIVADPGLLVSLNDQSLAWRRAKPKKLKLNKTA